jgi:hypothetical protein
MRGTGPSAGPPALKRLPGFEVGELVVAVGEAVVVGVGVGEAVVVGAGDGEEVAVGVGVSVVVCCASTVGCVSHAALRAKPLAKIARTTRVNFSKTRVRSVISPPALA